jgi:hypothetical protein
MMEGDKDKTQKPGDTGGVPPTMTPPGGNAGGAVR